MTDNLNYDPSNLLNKVIDHLNLKNDAALSRALKVAPPVVSKIRNKKLPIGTSMIVRLHEITGLPIKEIRSLMGDNREYFSKFLC